MTSPINKMQIELLIALLIVISSSEEKFQFDVERITFMHGYIFYKIICIKTCAQNVINLS